MKARQIGFTLIELMTVVAIISILLLIAIPAYQEFKARSKVAEGLVRVGELKKAVEEYIFSTSKEPPTNVLAGLGSPELYKTKWVNFVAVGSGTTGGSYANCVGADGDICVSFNVPYVTNETIIFVPTLIGNEDAIDWDCTGGTMRSNFRPSNCR